MIGNKAFVLVLSMILVPAILTASVQFPTSTSQFNSLVRGGTTIVDFSSKYCSGCNDLNLYFQYLSSKYPDSNLKFGRVDINELPGVSNSVRSLPAFFVYFNGNIIERLYSDSQQDLANLVRKYSTNVILN